MTTTHGRLRWLAVTIVLAVALAVALWSRGEWPRGDSTPPPDETVMAARAAAALEPCPTPPTGTRPGGRLVGLTLPCLGGPGTVDIGTALAGRPVLLNVWASWCAPCREEVPVLEAYRTSPGAVEVLGISADIDPAAALLMMTDLGAHYPSVLDADVRLRRELAGPPLLPANHLLLPDGVIRRIDPPVVFRDPAQVHQVLASHLAATG